MVVSRLFLQILTTRDISRGAQPSKHQHITQTTCRQKGARGSDKSLYINILRATLKEQSDEEYAYRQRLKGLAGDEFAKDGGRRDCSNLLRRKFDNVTEEFQDTGSFGISR